MANPHGPKPRCENRKPRRRRRETAKDGLEEPSLGYPSPSRHTMSVAEVICDDTAEAAEATEAREEVEVKIVNGLTSEVICTISLDPDRSIGQVKDLVSENGGGPAAEQRLLHGDQILDDEMLLCQVFPDGGHRELAMIRYNSCLNGILATYRDRITPVQDEELPQWSSDTVDSSYSWRDALQPWHVTSERPLCSVKSLALAEW